MREALSLATLAAQSARITAALERIVTPPVGGRVIPGKGELR